MTKPKAINRKKLVAFVLPIITKGVDPIQSFPCGLHIGAEGFKPRTIFNFSHITSLSYILYFVVSLGNDGICRQPTLYNSHFVSNIIRADEL